MELNPNNGKHLTLMLEAMEHGEIKAAYCIGENQPTPRRPPATAGHCSKVSTSSSCRTSS